jgi:hypothetical protein
VAKAAGRSIFGPLHWAHVFGGLERAAVSSIVSACSTRSLESVGVSPCSGSVVGEGWGGQLLHIAEDLWQLSPHQHSDLGPTSQRTGCSRSCIHFSVLVPSTGQLVEAAATPTCSS